LVRVPGDPEENEPEAKQLVQDLKNVLDELPEYLGYNGEAAIDIERARRSVHVYFEQEDFHLDVVPCIAPDGFDEVLYVPDRGFNEWIPSHPIGYINLLRELDEKYHQKVRPLIKLLKHFRNYHMKTRRPKSYWLGALVIHHIRKANGLDTTISLAELFHSICDAVYLQYDHLLHTSETATPNIPDPLLDHNISWNWERSHSRHLCAGSTMEENGHSEHWSVMIGKRLSNGGRKSSAMSIFLPPPRTPLLSWPNPSAPEAHL